MEDFKWTDELVEQFAEEYRFSSSRISLDQFKQSKQPKPKEYEILSFKEYGFIYELMDWQKYPCYTTPTFECPGRQVSLEYALKTKMEIHSVKRLSDGEVFTVGDKMQEEDGVYVIDAFWKNYGGNYLWVSYDQRNKYGSSLDSVKKAKEVLFTTEDGKEILDHGNYHDDYWTVLNGFEVCKGYAKKNVKYDIIESRTFSTKSAAEDWILYNKPSLSLNDILKVIKIETMTFHELKTLAKSKLKI